MSKHQKFYPTKTTGRELVRSIYLGAMTDHFTELKKEIVETGHVVTCGSSPVLSVHHAELKSPQFIGQEGLRENTNLSAMIKYSVRLHDGGL